MDSPVIAPTPPPKLLDQIRARVRVLHYSLRTEDVYVDWARRFILFHGKRHPRDMGAPEIEAFLSHLAVERRVSASTQNQAKAALLFLYKQVLEMEPPWLAGITVAKTTRRLPVVLTPGEVRRLLHELNGTMWLVASLLYGSGMRILEALRLRVKDVELECREFVVREGKGNKDRITVLSENLIAPLRAQLQRAQSLHHADLAEGFGAVYLPDALATKYPNAAKAWGWQYVFPSAGLSSNSSRRFRNTGPVSPITGWSGLQRGRRLPSARVFRGRRRFGRQFSCLRSKAAANFAAANSKFAAPESNDQRFNDGTLDSRRAGYRSVAACTSAM
jgi:integron integrase